MGECPICHRLRRLNIYGLCARCAKIEAAHDRVMLQQMGRVFVVAAAGIAKRTGDRR